MTQRAPIFRPHPRINRPAAVKRIAVNLYREQGKWAKLYNTPEWKRMRKRQLANNPLCKHCIEHGMTTPAKVADHIKRHNGNVGLFRDPSNLQSLCIPCHNSWKAMEERGTPRRRWHADGTPIVS